MSLPETFRCLLVEQPANPEPIWHMACKPVDELPAGDVLIRVQASSLNYKDALALHGHRGIVRKFPHVPGIDAVGVVIQSSSPSFQPDEQVLVTGHELGVERWGGWSELIRVPAEWILPIPTGLTPRECLALGTAGFTAAQCVLALQRHEILPASGEIVVSGATGGVGSLALRLLVLLGYHCVASTGKTEQTDWLRRLGARTIIPRDELALPNERPLLSARFAGGVDTVGGNVLANMVKLTGHRGCVAACGVAGGAELPLTVYPFILRGVTLAGIDSAWCPLPQRREIWRRLGAEWKLPNLLDGVTAVSLESVPELAKAMLAGQTTGRLIVEVEPGWSGLI
jgi:putative YhdH/YhfP family quinone oxidoreductase